MMLAMTLTIDTISNTHNKIVHEGQNYDILELIRSILRRYHVHREAWNKQEKVVLISQIPPREGAIKINYDASLKENWISAAAVCRNWKGDIIKARLCKARGVDPIKGEARAARLACLLAEEFAEYEVFLEWDAQFLVHKVVDPETTPDWIITLRATLSLHPLWHFQGTSREGNNMVHNLAC